jgi:Ca-activated chloride channel homolog
MGLPGSRTGRRGVTVAVAVVAAVAAVALGLTAIAFSRWGSAGSPRTASTAAPSPSASRQPSTAEIYTAVAPSVVTIEAVRPGTTAVDAAGTGIVVNADATILTARDFVRAQDNGSRIGLVVFSGIAALLVRPTTDKDALLAAIANLRTSRGTAIGLGILASIDAIADINPHVAPTGVDLSAGAPPADGGYEADTIVVLTDGANTQGVDPVTAAKQAAARRLRVYTIGFGTTEPGPFVCTANQIGGDGAFGGNRSGQPRGFGGGRRQEIDEDALTQVATITGGRYFQAKDARALTGVLMDLPNTIVLQRKDMEVTVWFALAGAILVLAAVGLSQWWNRPGAPARRPVTRPGDATPGNRRQGWRPST